MSFTIFNFELLMSYFNQLYPWCIIKPLPNLQRCTIARFRRRNEAEAHLQVIRRLLPHITYMIVFDPTPEREESIDDVGDRAKRSTASEDKLCEPRPKGDRAVASDAVAGGITEIAVENPLSLEESTTHGC